jgi:3'-5' exoribonuclease
MQKTVYIKDIEENTQVEGLFLVKEKHHGMTKAGKPYLAILLSDKTGDVKGRIWDNADKLGRQFIQGDIADIKSYAISYQGSLQLNINSIRKTENTEYRPQDFLPSSSIDPDECFLELVSLAQTIDNKYLRKLLDLFFKDNEFVSAFKTAPAAKSVHHDYINGLLEHTLNVTRLAIDISKYYKNIDRETLLTGAILHDIGKIHEFSYEKNFEYTDSGRLIGHITIGVEMVNDKINNIPDFPQNLSLIIKHLILSHHGQYEFGSPKRPKTLEALMLNYLDDLDSKIGGLTQFIKKEKSSETKWTGYHRLLERYFYTDTFIEDEKNGAE